MSAVAVPASPCTWEGAVAPDHEWYLDGPGGVRCRRCGLAVSALTKQYQTWVESMMDFIAAQEWAGREVLLVYKPDGSPDIQSTPKCLDCGALYGQGHSDGCWWLSIIKGSKDLK